ncbi:restriction endonuclease [Robertmurraya beringensis]|uniref:Restriction endonuclease n=1 Tax=Robertmurraya beringensis TaxID=641660 RepID=A0ABV6KSF8_9BACI
MATKYQFVKTISNSRLSQSKTIKALTQYELDRKVDEQRKKWKSQVNKLNERDKVENELLRAERLIKQAQQSIEVFQNMLKTSARVHHYIDFDSILISDEYPPFIFKEATPNINDFYLKHNVPSPSYWEDLLLFIKSSRLKKESAAKLDYDKEYGIYQEKKQQLYNQYMEKKIAFDSNKSSYNNLYENIREGYLNGNIDSICDYFSLALEHAPLPKELALNIEVNYLPVSQTLIVDYTLPNQDDLPRAVSYTYVKTRKEITVKKMTQKEFDAFYDSVIYQLTLKTIHELLSSDSSEVLQTVVFNGYVHGTSLATGNDFTSCIVTLNVGREDFLKLNLEKVDPKECFRSLKGLSIGALKNLSPVKPYMQFSKNENRFVESRNIIAEVENIPNISKMPWDDFEHLVGGLFERMFYSDNNEVKITKASRDGGIDAIVFDPDPIRGGKFVVQAKRYNAVVQPSAVRDLYGTMIDEGATKGFLVTTSYYGEDSYRFANDKPITLIDGSYLVHLFQENGYSVKISSE